MKKNVGNLDAMLRTLLGFFLIWLGLFPLDGLEGTVVGILVVCCSALPFSMAITRTCFVFRWLDISSIRKND